MQKVRVLFFAGLLVILSIFPLLVRDTSLEYLVRTAGFIGLYVILALGLNITIGFAGLFDLGFMAFYSIGAYTAAIASIHGCGLILSTLLAVTVSVAFRLLLGAPVLRLRGDYLAIVTPGFGEITRLVLKNYPDQWSGGLPRVGKIAFRFSGVELSENIHYYYSDMGGGRPGCDGVETAGNSRIGARGLLCAKMKLRLN